MLYGPDRFSIGSRMVISAATLFVLVSSDQLSAQAAAGVEMKVGKQPSAKAASPKPATGAKQKSQAASVGKGAARMTTNNTPGDRDSFWVEEIDIDGDGSLELTDMLYDDEDGVLFIAADKTLKCSDRGQAEGAVLMAVYVKGNRLNRPVGSGWWIAELDAGECKMPGGGLWGCKFNAKGDATECGVAYISPESDDIRMRPAPTETTSAPSPKPAADSSKSAAN